MEILPVPGYGCCCTLTEVIIMKIAIPISRNRISPVFDSARTMLMVELNDGREGSRHEIKIQDGSPLDRVNRLIDNNVEVLLCGAVSRSVCEMLESVDIRVIPFLTGNAETLLEAFIQNRISDPQFLMPGRGGRRRRRIRGRHGFNGERGMS
jgi:predicted Fe-Mo cluster-binding NifX family protein